MVVAGTFETGLIARLSSAACSAMQRDPSAVSLEKFVLNSLSSIAQETSGRGHAQKDVREAAIKLLGAPRPRSVQSITVCKRDRGADAVACPDLQRSWGLPSLVSRVAG